jgi:SNARE protein
MTNQQLMDQGNQLMDETDQAIARSKQVNFSCGSAYL